jgi:protein disulfide-isomerase
LRTPWWLAGASLLLVGGLLVFAARTSSSVAEAAEPAPAIAQRPYDEQANATVDVQRGLAAVRTDHRKLLLVFGANWCEDCRQLDKALHGSSQALIDGHFDVVKIDVGNFDKNLELAARYGDPIKKGIPAVVVVDADSHILYSTKGGELANARRMGDNGIYDFLSKNVSAAN